MAQDQVRIGVIGLGTAWRSHEKGYRDMLDRARIVAVCDLSLKVVEAKAMEYGAAAYTDYRALLDDPRVEAVDIILPHHLHFPVTMAAIESRKHVMVEKPIAVRFHDGLRLCEAARAAGVLLTVAENTRFVQAYTEAEKLIQQGVVGAPRLVRTFICGSEVARLTLDGHWKGRRSGSGGGVITDAGPHSLYLLKWLVGEIAEVQAFHSRLIQDSEVEDNAVLAGHFVNGALFTTEYSFTVEAPWNEKLEYHGDRGSVVVDQLMNPPARLYQGPKDYEGTVLSEVPYDPVGWKTQSMAAGVKDFVNAIRQDRSPAVDPLDCCYTLKVIEKAYESVSGGHPVTVPPG